MRTLIRGEASALAEHCQNLGTDSQVLAFTPEGSHRCWSSVRHVLTQLRHRDGSQAVDSVLQRHLPAASQVPGVLPAGLSPSESDLMMGSRLSASVESHLSHNILVQSPIFEAWAALLAELLVDTDYTLVVENLARVDRESLAALRALYRRFPDDAPALVAGYDPHQEAEAPDSNGLLWHNPAEDIHTVALGFVALLGSQVIELPSIASSAPSEAASPTEISRAATTDAIDDRAWARLRQNPPDAELSAETCEIVIAGVKACFACFGFTSALQLGLQFLSHSPSLTPSQKADLHGIIALSAHNRQFRSRGNRDLAEFLQSHLVRALEAETLATRRSCLCYRLAVTVGRRQKRFDAALEWADQAVEEAASASRTSDLQRAHLEAWGRNIRAYILLGLKRPADARIDCESAFAVIDGAIESPLAALKDPDPLIQEAGFTHSLLADNMAALAKFRDDGDGFVHWKKIADEIARVAPGLVRFEAILWIDLYRGLLRYDLAVSKAEQGLKSARLEEDPLRAFNYAVQLGDLLDRQGHADSASRAFEEAMEVYHRLGEPRFMRRLDGYAAMSFLRSGAPDRARLLFQGSLDHLDTSDTQGQAQIHACLGFLESMAGQAEEAERQTNRAIDLAVESGDRETLLDVAIMTGRSCQILHRQEDAMAAYQQALRLIENATEPSSSGLFAIHLGLAELGDAPESRTLEALKLWPSALSETDAWWDLPRLWRLIQQPSDGLAGALAAPEHEEALNKVRLAAAQRHDCSLGR